MAIVSDRPGVTRDRIEAICELHNRRFTLCDTGGMLTGSEDDLTEQIREVALRAVVASDLVIFLIDARSGLTATEEEIALRLRSSGKPLIVAANKIDSATREELTFDLYRLGLGEIIPISAEQGRGLVELEERLLSLLPQKSEEAAEAAVPLAIIGRPNVGKSSLFNRIVLTDRALVSPVSGTTRDPVDALFERAGTLYRIVDTAGIRRHLGGAEDVERVSVQKARQAMQQASLVIAMADAARGVEHQDRALLGLVGGSRTPAILAVNKIDLLPRGVSLQGRLQAIRDDLRFAPHVPVVPVSALTGEGVEDLMATLDALRAEAARRFATADLNRALQEVVQEKHPPSDDGRSVRFYYMTQAGTAPPRFLIFGNGRRVRPTYRRFMESRLRARLGLRHSPIALGFRRSRKPR